MPGILARQGLNDSGQFGVEQAEQGMYQDLGDSAAARGPDALRGGQRPVIECITAAWRWSRMTQRNKSARIKSGHVWRYIPKYARNSSPGAGSLVVLHKCCSIRTVLSFCADSKTALVWNNEGRVAGKRSMRAETGVVDPTYCDTAFGLIDNEQLRGGIPRHESNDGRPIYELEFLP